MDQLKAIRYFVKVVETGSFTLAAKAFGVPASSLSRRVADLEQSLGATLLKRTTRTVNVTEVGISYYNQVTEVLSLLKDSDETVRAYQTTPMGVLNISAMVGFGERILIPLLDQFNTLYPQITLNVSLSDELTALGRDEVDIAIRGGYAPQERVIGIKLMENEFITVAAPSYISSYGFPDNPQALKQHQGLFFQTPAGPTPWLSELDGHWQDVSAPSALTTNNGKWLVDRAVAGKGILVLPRWVLQSYLDSGQLVELSISGAIKITQNPDLAVYLLYQKQRYQVPKVKAAVDFLVANIKGNY